MPLQNVFEIDVDIKSKTAIRPVTVTQNDAVIFIFRVFDEGRIYNIEDGTTFAMTSTRPDKQAVMSVGKSVGANIVEFKLGSTELVIKGKVDAVIQVYDSAGRVSTIPFRYEVLNDPSTDYIPSEDEKTLIQQVLGDGPQILADAQQATEAANTAAASANDAAENATTVASGVAQAIADTEAATEAANTVAEAAALAEQERELAEETRQQNEQARISAETAREDAEAVREQQEANRQSATQTAVEGAQQATSDALDVADNTRFVEPYNPTTLYKANNIISYNGSSYIAKGETQGNLPTDTAYWGLLAQRGVDGTGAVSTVNGLAPDEDGNVEIIIPDPDLSGLATKQELQDLDDEVQSAGAIIQSQIASVNNKVDVHLADEAAHGIGDKTTLLTTKKSTLVSAINELFTFANDGKTDIASVVGSPATNGNTFTQLKMHIQNSKNNLATNLTTKGQSSAGTETLDALVSKVANIDPGAKIAKGSFTASSGIVTTISNLSFTPDYVLVKTNPNNANNFLLMDNKGYLMNIAYALFVTNTGSSSYSQRGDANGMDIIFNGFKHYAQTAGTYQFIAIKE